MKTKLIAAFAAFAILFSLAQSHAQQAATAAASELKELVGKIQTKLRAGKKTEADLADELKGFDELLAKHKDEKTDDVAQILFMKAMLYDQVLHESTKAEGMYAQLKKDFPQSKQVTLLKQQDASKQIKKELVAGKAFPDFDVKDLAGKPLAIANFKGKVVLLDFWATWCGPCVHELPNVIKTYEKHHDKGFEIIGISLDQSEEKLKDFIKEKNMTWAQYFDAKGWSNKLAVKYGIQSIPATFLLDGEGKIIGADLRGDDLEQAVTKALAKN